MLMMLWTKRMKRKNFVQNGGLQLQEFMRSRGRENTFIKIFTESEMKVATNNYADDMKIGTGGYGAVYKGMLEGGKLVAVKKALVVEDEDNKEFLNELIILTQIHHKHIVKLLGCCLETKTPLLVYEYASNGTLADHLHETLDVGYMGWDQRLTVALQSAEALSYLHRAASPPILHQDVKSINILPSMIQVENELREILQNLHGVGTYALAEGTTVVIQSASEVGAVTMENSECVIHSNSSQWKRDSQIYGFSTDLLR